MNKISKVIVDIETVGKDLEEIDEYTREKIEKQAERFNYDEDSKKMKTNFSPLFGEIVVIGMLNPDTQKGQIFFQCGDAEIEDYEKDGVKFVTGSEKVILEKFWENIKHFQTIITFNGRGFDAPYLMIRSAIHKIRPSRNLMPYRYSNSAGHIDLLDQMTFYNSMQGVHDLNAFCQAFGIESPKEGELTGYKVKEFYNQGKYKEVAEYNLGDLKATAKLYEYWEKYLKW